MLVGEAPFVIPVNAYIEENQGYGISNSYP
jgi:hypothetical protein